MRPIGNRVIVRRSEVKKEPDKLIELPEFAKEKPLEGVVIEAGIKTSVQKGDLVLFGKYAGSEITVKGKEYLILNEDEILVVL